MADVEVVADDDIKDEVKNDDIAENDNINEQNTYNTKTKETIE